MKDRYSAVHRYERNTEGRDFVVGDVHGCFSQLAKELEARNFDPLRDRLFSVGDLIDRGPESASLLEVVERFGIKAVRGNHEEAIIRWHRGEESAASLLGNGSEWLLDMHDDRISVDRLASYMTSLPYVIEVQTNYGLIGIVHADAPAADWANVLGKIESEGADGSTRLRAIWSRSRWKARSTPLPKSRGSLLRLFGAGRTPIGRPATSTFITGVTAVIVGHTPMARTSLKGNVINIDTGAVYGGGLTLLDLADVPALLAESGNPMEPVTERIDEPVPETADMARQGNAFALGFSHAGAFPSNIGSRGMRLTVRMSALRVSDESV
jgi:serine/threonine protein phosphatase 1